MARTERQEDGTRGIGTMTRPGPRQRPQQPPEAAPAAPDQRRGRRARQVPAQRPAAGQQAATGQRFDADQRKGGRREQRVPPQRAAVTRPVGEQPASEQWTSEQWASGPRRGFGRRPGGRPADVAESAAAPARPWTRPRAGALRRVPPAERVSGPQPARTTGPQPTVPAARPAETAQVRPTAQPLRLRQATAAVGGAHRMPFVLLLCGLLGGALISALVISTTLAEGSFQISKLQDSTSSLAKQQQSLEEQVAQAQSPQQIAQRAGQLGMRRVGELWFVDLKAGKTSNDGPTWVGAVNAPGYAP